MNENILEAAVRLREAAMTGMPCKPVRDLIDADAVADAYRVQKINIDHAVTSGARVVGWKAGLTAASVRDQLGVEAPDFGALLNECAFGSGEPVPLGRLLQPKVEAEVAFVLARDLPPRRVTAADVLRSTAFVVPALEIVDSRIDEWDITLVDTVADNASSGLYTLGLEPRRLVDVDLGAATMELLIDGVVASTGTSAACLGHPVNAVVWLANTLRQLGTPLQAGQVILSGALGPMVPVPGPCFVEARISGLGVVCSEFVDG